MKLGDILYESTKKKNKAFDKKVKSAKKSLSRRNTQKSARNTMAHKSVRNTTDEARKVQKEIVSKPIKALVKNVNTEEQTKAIKQKNKQKNVYNAPNYKGRKGANQHKSLDNLNKEAKKNYYDAWQNHKLSRGILGTYAGVIQASPVSLVADTKVKNKKLANSKAFKAGQFAGQTGSYLLGYGAADKLATKGAEKALTSTLGKKAVKSVAKNKLVRKGTEKALTSAGKKLTTKTIEKGATKTAKGLVKGATKDVVSDLTAGTLIDTNMAYSEGHKIGSKEYAKDMAINAAGNLVLGGAAETLPVLKSALKSNKANKKVVEVLTANGKKLKTESKLAEKRSVSALEDNLYHVSQKSNKADRLKALKENKYTVKDKASVKGLKDDLKVKKAEASNVSTETLKPTEKPQEVPNATLKETDLPNAELKIKEPKTKELKTLETKAVKSVGKKAENRELKDLGADVLHESTKESNAKNYGIKDDVVTGTPFGEVSQGARTVRNSPMIDAKSQAHIDDAINEGEFTTVTIRNKVAMERADNTLANTNTLEEAHQRVKAIVDGNRQAKSEDVALGYKLAQEYQAKGDYDKVVDVLSDVVQLESETGRTLQAMRIFNALTPEGRIKAVVKMKNKIKASSGVDVKLSDELLDALANAKTEAEIAKANKQIRVDLWNQVPPNWVEKANAWRYLSMLGNPKTHIRNILGNALFVPVKGVRNYIATGLEKTLLKDGERSKAILTHNDNDLIKMGKDDFANVKDMLTGNSKYIEGRRDLDAKMFNTKALEKLNKLNSWALEKEDEIFMEFAYKRAYAQYLKANKEGSITDELLEHARKYACDEALNSTYRDASYLANVLARAKKYSNVPLKDIEGDTMSEQIVKKAGATALEAVVPFTKTPINILRRGIDYSPIGLVKGMVKLLGAKGDARAMQRGISDLAEGITGSGIMLLGFYMGSKGMAQGQLDTTSREGQFKSLNGEQPYSIRIGDYTYTMDWAVPSSMPFFVGVEASKTGGDDWKKGIDSLSKITDPLFNLSMLSGLNNALDNTFSQSNSTLETAKNMGESYISQYIPTVLGQTARTLTKERRTTTSTEESQTFRDIERFGRQLGNKIPFVTDLNEPYVNIEGETEVKHSGGDYVKSALQNFLSPGTAKSTKMTDVNRELTSLINEVGSDEIGDIIPKGVSGYDVNVGGKSFRLTEKELTAYKKAKGTEAMAGLEKLFSSNKYENMSLDEKKKAIKDVYDDAQNKAKDAYLKYKGYTSGDIAYMEMPQNKKDDYSKVKKSMSKEEYGKAFSSQQKYDSYLAKAVDMVNNGVTSYKQAKTINGSIYDSTFKKAQALAKLGYSGSEIERIKNNADKVADYDKNGYKSKAEIMSYVNAKGGSQTEKRALFSALAPANWNNPY